MANRARNVEDLERKYNFASLLGLDKNVKMFQKSIIKVENELANMLNTLIINLKDVLDSQSEVSLWFYSGTPTIDNEPYKNWTEPAEHIGDIYYNQETGYVYQYNEEGWILKDDSNLVQAMALTNTELDTITDHERKVYFSQPSPPYSSGDWWILDDGTLKTCQLGKITGEYDAEDFIIANKYVPTIATADGDFITVKHGQVIKMSDTFASFEDLATGGKTIINGANITTGTINTDKITIGNKNVQLDEEGLKLKNGAKVVGENGLMNTYLFGTKEISMVGYLPHDIESTDVERQAIRIIAEIPDRLNIVSAKLILFHIPTKWGYYEYAQDDTSGISKQGKTMWGSCKKLKAYKCSNINSRIYSNQWFSEYTADDNSQYDEIEGALGEEGWTPPTPSDTTHDTEKKISIDIKNSISIGLNEILIQPSDDIKTMAKETAMSNSACMTAILKIDGYMSYE